MDKELEQYYDDMREMFNSKGWQCLVDDLKDNLSTVDSLVNVKDAEDLWFRKGQTQILSFLINLEDNIKIAQEQAEVEISHAENL
jgi:hypothetical protein